MRSVHRFCVPLLADGNTQMIDKAQLAAVEEFKRTAIIAGFGASNDPRVLLKTIRRDLESISRVPQ